jgi:hypothetical protein
MPATLRVEGIREVQAAFRSVSRDLATQFGEDLKRAAEPVASSARDKISRYRGASLGTIRPRRRGPVVYVEQAKRKVTGRRGDFGGLQMRHGLIPALEENEGQIFATVSDALDRYASSAGF